MDTFTYLWSNVVMTDGRDGDVTFGIEDVNRGFAEILLLSILN